uniref:hyccin-like n=1 Tax=Myxine glutinosa TaxID=7769 RepID=UPI00358DDF8C
MLHAGNDGSRCVWVAIEDTGYIVTLRNTGHVTEQGGIGSDKTNESVSWPITSQMESLRRKALAMDRRAVEEWLSEFKTLPESSIPEYALTVHNKTALASAIYKVIGEPQSELLEPVCHQLCEFARSGDVFLSRFTLQFLPALIFRYLTIGLCQDHRLQSSGCLEALLLALYNLQIVEKDGCSKILSFIIPSLSKPSIFHEPGTMGSLAIVESTILGRAARVAYVGPLSQCEVFTAQNRFEVLGFLLLCYNSAIAYMPRSSYRAFCHMCSRLCVSGFARQGRRWRNPLSRISLSSDLLVQILTGLIYIIHNGERDFGQEALDDVVYRAQMELYPEPVMVGRAMQNLVTRNKDEVKDQTSIPVDVTPTYGRVSRGAVTSASIRRHRWRKEGIEEKGGEEVLRVVEPDDGFSSGASSTSRSMPVNRNKFSTQRDFAQRGFPLARHSATDKRSKSSAPRIVFESAHSQVVQDGETEPLLFSSQPNLHANASTPLLVDRTSEFDDKLSSPKIFLSEWPTSAVECNDELEMLERESDIAPSDRPSNTEQNESNSRDTCDVQIVLPANSHANADGSTNV